MLVVRESWFSLLFPCKTYRNGVGVYKSGCSNYPCLSTVLRVSPRLVLRRGTTRSTRRNRPVSTGRRGTHSDDSETSTKVSDGEFYVYLYGGRTENSHWQLPRGCAVLRVPSRPPTDVGLTRRTGRNSEDAGLTRTTRRLLRKCRTMNSPSVLRRRYARGACAARAKEDGRRIHIGSSLVDAPWHSRIFFVTDHHSLSLRVQGQAGKLFS